MPQPILWRCRFHVVTTLAGSLIASTVSPGGGVSLSLWPVVSRWFRYSPGLRPIRVLDTAPKHQVVRARGLLNETCPSDHMALVCDMAFAGSGQ